MTNLLSKTQRKTKKSERYQNLSEEGKDKRQKMPEKDTKIQLKKKEKISLVRIFLTSKSKCYLSIEEIII